MCVVQNNHSVEAEENVNWRVCQTVIEVWYEIDSYYNKKKTDCGLMRVSLSGSAMPLPVPIATRRDEIAYYKRNILKTIGALPQINVRHT